MQHETVIPADTRLRTQVIVWGTGTLVLGLACLLYLKTSLDELTALHTAAPQLAAEQIQHLFFLLAVGSALLTGLLAGIISYLAVRVLKSGQYPPPGMRVIRDTKLKTGREARLTAIVAMTLAALALLCGIGLSGRLLWASHDLGWEHRSPRLEAAVPPTDRAGEKVREKVSSVPDQRTSTLHFPGVGAVITSSLFLSLPARFAYMSYQVEMRAPIVELHRTLEWSYLCFAVHAVPIILATLAAMALPRTPRDGRC